jgi:hypothetical protein
MSVVRTFAQMLPVFCGMPNSVALPAAIKLFGV